MESCKVCGRPDAAYVFRMLTVQTLHIRDITGEKRVQALGRIEEAGICADCAKAYLLQAKNPQKPLLKKCIPFAAIFVFGVVLCVVFWKRERAFLTMGLGAIVCGVLSIWSLWKTAEKKKTVFSGLSETDALALAAWQRLAEAMPKKDGENDLTYIPITEKTLSMRNGDLMAAYDLLPAIAKRAWNILHGADETPTVQEKPDIVTAGDLKRFYD